MKCGVDEKLNENFKWEISKNRGCLLVSLLLVILSACSNEIELQSEYTVSEKEMISMEEIGDLERDVTRLVEEIGGLERDVARLVEEIGGLERDVARLENHLYFLQNSNHTSYITIDEGYLITGLERQSGDYFDFYIYRFDCFLGEAYEQGCTPSSSYVEIVVLQDVEVFDIIRSYTDTRIRMNCPPNLILELDYGLLICDGMTSGTRGIAFEFHLLRGGSFVRIDGDFVNPSIDFSALSVRTVQRLAGMTPGHAWVISHIIDDVLLPVSSLYNVWDLEHEVLIWRHSRWVDGEWEIVEDIENDMVGLGVHPYGDEYWQTYWFGDRWEQ